MTNLDATHEPALMSWVDSANTPETDFPIQNLPWGRFHLKGERNVRLGVAIGDCVLDVAALGTAAPASIAAVLALSAVERQALRARLSKGLQRGSADESAWRAWLHRQSDITLGLPCDIRDYTDFYIGIHHALAVGKLFRPDQPLLPNYRWLPIAYHGRASTILPSGAPVFRPQGQVLPAGHSSPVLRPTERLDFELEVGLIIGRPNALGQPIPIHQAEQHLFGLTLFNDWSARDIQAWEYQPLGPFLGKNFASTLSPWIVTLEALAPFRMPLQRPSDEPPALPYLDDAQNRQHGAFDISLEVFLHTEAMRENGLPAHCISRSHFGRAAYWTAAQMITHHTVNGCALSSGDLLATGTLSGAAREEAGSMLELTQGGKTPITLPDGSIRRFLENGDEVIFQGRAQRTGFRAIGFGQCRGRVVG